MLLALLPAAAQGDAPGCVSSLEHACPRPDWKLKWYEKNTNCGTYLGVHKGSLNTCTAGGWYPELSDGTFDEQAGVRNDSVTYEPRTTAKVTKCDTKGATIELGEGNYTATWRNYLTYSVSGNTTGNYSSPSLNYYCTSNPSIVTVPAKKMSSDGYCMPALGEYELEYDVVIQCPEAFRDGATTRSAAGTGLAVVAILAWFF